MSVRRSQNHHGGSKTQVPGLTKRKPIYGRAQSASGSAFRNVPSTATAFPLWWTGTETEWLVYRTLTSDLHLREGQGSDFSYQSRLSTTGGLGGRLELGGLIADFLFEQRRLIINPLSEYYHYRQDIGNAEKERQNGAALAGQGYTVVYIDSDDVSRDPAYYVREALEYRDHSKLTSGLF